MFDWLTDFVGDSPLTYAVVLGVVALDAFFPVVPGETVIVTAAVLAVGGDLSVWLVGASAVVGALLGDQVSYVLGRFVGDPVAERLFADGRSKELYDWAERQMRRHGQIIVVGARFVPGGRTAATFASGALEVPWRRFIVADAIGCLLWGSYATILGAVGGETFAESLWKPLGVALGVAVVVSVIGEGLRRWSESRDGKAKQA